MTRPAACVATTEFGQLGRSGEAYADLSVTLIDAGTGEIVDRDQTPEHAIEGCAKMWQTAGIAGTQPYQRVESPWAWLRGPAATDLPGAGLLAALPTGQVGVFPDTDCVALGLPKPTSTESRCRRAERW